MIAKGKIVLVVCKSGRLDALVTALHNSKGVDSIYVVSEARNESVARKVKGIFLGATTNVGFIQDVAWMIKADLVVIGPEDSLSCGVIDTLKKDRFKCVGPTMKLAQIETSKVFARRLISRIMPFLNPEYRVFKSTKGMRAYMKKLGSFVIKPDKPTGGKGVKVYGEHLFSYTEALDYCSALFEQMSSVIIEERLEGEEFSYQSFTDGVTTLGTFPVQDHKRALSGDEGPNTGGMGSYSCADHLLPFLNKGVVELADLANRRVAAALSTRYGAYKGILFGGFIYTAKGLKLIEYNCRFGDPEIMNVLSIMDNDFLEVCEAITNQSLDKVVLTFANKATVCKYVVPQGYPLMFSKNNAEIEIPSEELAKVEGLNLFWGAIQTNPDGSHRMTGSRALAVVGVADTLSDAESIAENAARQIGGKVFYRSDIGTAALLEKRVKHMQDVLSQNT